MTEPSIAINDPTVRRPSPYKWAVVAMLWFVCFFNYADRMAIYSVFPLLKSEMHLTDVQLGIVGSAFMWVYAAMSPIAGMVGDRVSRKTLIVGGLLFWSAVTVATAFSTTLTQLVICRAAEGLGEAFYFPAAMSLVSDYHGKSTRSRAMSICQSSVYAGTIGGGVVAGFMAEHYGWRSSFYVFGGLGVVLGAVLIALLREPQRGYADAAEAEVAETAGAVVIDGPGDEVGEAFPGVRGATGRHGFMATLRAVFDNPLVLVLVVVFMGANFVAAVFLTWMPSFLNRKFNMGLAMAGLNGTAWLQIASVLGVISGGFIADALSRRMSGGRLLTQAAGLLLGVPFIFLTGYTMSTTILVLAMVGFGFFKGLYDANLWASLYDVVPVAHRGSALGFMNALGWVGGSIAPVAIAAAAEQYGMSACLSATSVIYAAASILMLGGYGMMKLKRSSPDSAHLVPSTSPMAS